MYTTPTTPPARGSQPGPLSVSHSVIVEMVRVAALEVPGVLKVSRGGPLASAVTVPTRESGV